ncbi:MAG: HD domain-containing protein [Candidatus Aminicenantes bacterium]|nr:HD domain-containing protein [Candidatus Aminicenantes bacterium]
MNKQKNTRKLENAPFRHKDFFIQHFGKDVYAVGGYVRDLLLNPHMKDANNVDILITFHSIEKIVETLQSFGKIDLVGKSFGIIKFVLEDRTYDIALPRTDSPKKTSIRGHRDFVIMADPDIPIEKDLERRDFRCNSISLRLCDNEIFDPFDGEKDIENKIIRLTNPDSFPEDPLRVIRAARFASVHGFSIDPEIYGASKDIDLSGLSIERINEELFRILLESQKPSIGLEELFKLSALRQIFPELYRLSLSIQDSIFHPEKDSFGHHTVWQHTKITVDQAKRLAKIFNVDRVKELALLFAALFHDVGKAATARWEYKRGRMAITNYGHDITSANITKEVFDRHKIHSFRGHDLRKTVLSLIKAHHRASELWQNRETVTKKAFNRLAADIHGEIELVALLDAADRSGRDEKPIQGLDQEGQWLLNKFEELNVSKTTIQPLILGRDLIDLGIRPGPEMGAILKKLYELQLDNDFDTRSKGLILAKNIIKLEEDNP